MRKYVILLSVLLLAGCGKKEEPVETTPVYMSAQNVTFDSYDTVMHYTVPDDMAFKSIGDTNAEVVLNLDTGETATIDYIQGNSLNNFVSSYYNGIDDNTKSKVENDEFTTETMYYGFRKSEKNVYVMVKGPVSYEDQCKEILDAIELD